MTHVLRPPGGGGREELPRQHQRRSGRTESHRLLVLLVGGEFELLVLRKAWSELPVDVDRYADLAAALVMVGKLTPDLVVIGESTGSLDLLDFLRALRQVDPATVVVVGLDKEHLQLESAALAAGATTVAPRPFSPLDLLGLLHPGPRGGVKGGSRPLPVDLGRLKVDAVTPRIWLDGIELLLPHMEFRLLRHLAERQDEIVSRADLETAAWGDGAAARSNSLSVHIARLRRRFQARTGADWICAVRGFGYRLAVPVPVGKQRPKAQT